MSTFRLLPAILDTSGDPTSEHALPFLKAHMARVRQGTCASLSDTFVAATLMAAEELPQAIRPNNSPWPRLAGRLGALTWLEFNMPRPGKRAEPAAVLAVPGDQGVWMLLVRPGKLADGLALHPVAAGFPLISEPKAEHRVCWAALPHLAPDLRWRPASDWFHDAREMRPFLRVALAALDVLEHPARREAISMTPFDWRGIDCDRIDGAGEVLL